MPKVRAVLFDLGGTLIDERDFAGWSELARGIYLDLTPDALAHAYTEVKVRTDRPLGSPDPDPGGVEFWREVLSRAAEREVSPDVARRFVQSRPLGEGRLSLFSDVRRCLDRLAREHRKLAVVSNSTSEARVRRLLDRAEILDYFSHVVSSGTEGVAKPDPEIFRRAVSRLGVSPSEALHVGDLAHTDAEGARRAGLHAVWLNRDGTGLGDDPPEITSLLEVPLCVRRIERGSPPA